MTPKSCQQKHIIKKKPQYQKNIQSNRENNPFKYLKLSTTETIACFSSSIGHCSPRAVLYTKTKAKCHNRSTDFFPEVVQTQATPQQHIPVRVFPANEPVYPAESLLASILAIPMVTLERYSPAALLRVASCFMAFLLVFYFEFDFHLLKHIQIRRPKTPTDHSIYFFGLSFVFELLTLYALCFNTVSVPASSISPPLQQPWICFNRATPPRFSVF